MKTSIPLGCLYAAAFCVASACSTRSSTSRTHPVPATDTEDVTETAVSPATTNAGKMLFERTCASCHGMDGSASGGGVKVLKSTLLDAPAISQTITNGRGGMPAFGGQLTPQEVQSVTDYVIRLQP